MTPKQTKFADCIISGMNQSDAYRAAYDAENMAPETIHSRAYDLAKDSEITARIEDGNLANRESALMTREEVVKEAKTNLSLARDANQLGPANGALKLAAELSGLTQAQPATQVAITQITINKTYKSEKSEEAEVIEAEEWTTE